MGSRTLAVLLEQRKAVNWMRDRLSRGRVFV
jgi:hypothetical protein